MKRSRKGYCPKSVKEAAKMLNMFCCIPIHVYGDMDQALSRILGCLDLRKCRSNVLEVHERQHSVLGVSFWNMGHFWSRCSI